MERVFAHKADTTKGGQKLLVKWRGLPYAESTFETLQDVIRIGGQNDIIEYQVPLCSMTKENMCCWVSGAARPGTERWVDAAMCRCPPSSWRD